MIFWTYPPPPTKKMLILQVSPIFFPNRDQPWSIFSLEYFYITHFTHILTITVASKWHNTLIKHKWSPKPLNSVLPQFQKNTDLYKALFFVQIQTKYRSHFGSFEKIQTSATLKLVHRCNQWASAPSPAWYFDVFFIYVVVVYYTCFIRQELRSNNAKPNFNALLLTKTIHFSDNYVGDYRFWKKTDFLFTIQT